MSLSPSPSSSEVIALRSEEHHNHQNDDDDDGVYDNNNNNLTFSHRRCCFTLLPSYTCFQRIKQHHADNQNDIVYDHHHHHHHQHHNNPSWWNRGWKRLREFSELLWGPKWKTFIRRFGGKSRTGFRGKWEFEYDPWSYKLNFDNNEQRVVDEPGFSARFATVQTGNTEIGAAGPVFK